MRKTLIATGLVLATMASAHAETPATNTMSNFSYDYAEARIGISPLTYGGGFSRSIHPNAHITGSIDTRFKSDWDANFGIGFHAPVNNWADITGEIKALSVKNDRYNSSGGKFGVEVNLGVRQWLGPQLEVGGKIGHTTIDRDDKVIGSIMGRFHATELFSIGVEGKFNGLYGDQAIITTRFKF
ncbi:hypothetical protein A3K86_13970 [Photobacterium jeanii]|uniref:Outer membrane protein beta-barrel domain-containing protein n=1 Tax=Photobacterium jeanii TaxID=858640 RepID=A0A178K8M1_9GAMM|nr:hypothetical protein [Photobacterium jeanii]OAN13678.1 hypothetical protein A3K86_13970 [Photobacterium jeanii]PST88799.1 hypothetical protein C9I91_15835 [Photobacterium jeanii]